jgi:4-carboxymuconolactone decarboxylase
MAALPDLTGELTGKAKDIYDRMLAKRKAQGTGLRGLYIPLMNHPELAQLIEQRGQRPISIPKASTISV